MVYYYVLLRIINQSLLLKNNYAPPIYRPPLFKSIITLFFVLLFSNACQFEDEIKPTELVTPLSKASDDGDGDLLAASTGGEIILGDKLENPYSLQNMQLAWNIQKQNNETIYSTHRYIRFLPKNEDELDILENTENIDLYDHPLDYNIISNGDYYHDPSIATDLPTYQYASIPIEQALPSSISYTILEQLYIPDEEDVLSDALVYEALKITGNLTAEEHRQNDEHPNNGNGNNNGNGKNDDSNTLFGGSSWRPAGKIQVFDHAVGNYTVYTKNFSLWEPIDCEDGGIPIQQIQLIDENCRYAVYTYTTTSYPGSYVGVHGAKVRARRWFTTRTSYTDEQGNYSVNGTFKRPANYSIKWKRYQFTVRSGAFGRAKYNGPKQKGDWNVKMGSPTSGICDDIQQYYAIIFQAAHDYYYNDIKGLQRPPQNSFWKPQMKISAIFQTNSINGRHEAWRRTFGIANLEPV